MAMYSPKEERNGTRTTLDNSVCVSIQVKAVSILSKRTMFPSKKR